MSTSPSRAAIQPPAAESQASAEFQPFPYDTIPAELARAVARGRGTATPSFTSEQQALAEAAAREAQALAQGRQQGEAEARKIFEEQLARERSNVATLLTQFAADRAAYFEKVEAEVVQLALSIARKILHREAQLDPLLLAGIVRVALEKIDGATKIILRVHPQNAADWRRYLATQLDPAELPEIVEDVAQPEDRCTLETSMGTSVIGLDIQLKEIEQGLLDLLAARPETP